MKVSDAVAGLALVLVAIGVWAEARTFPPAPAGTYGAAFFPSVLAGGLCLCGLMLVLNGYRERHVQPLATAAPWMRSPRTLANVALTPLLILGYVLVVEWLGFIPTAFAIVFLLSWRLGTRILTAAGIALVVAVAVRWSFGELLRVPLPPGEILGFAW